jgi:Carboxypeptidase regulatory-like domain
MPPLPARSRPHPLRFGLLLLLLLAAVITPRLAAQEVRGQVLDDSTGAPVAGVQVMLLDSAGGVFATDRTTASGQFDVVAHSPGRYRVRFQIPGYRMLVSPLLDVAAGETHAYSLRLTRMPAALMDTLLVEGKTIPWNLEGFYRRRASVHGAYMTRDEWQQWSGMGISYVMQRMNRFGFHDTGHMCSGVPVFLDGNLLPDGVDPGDLFLNDLAAIEIHRWPEIPFDLHVAPMVCGVVELWSQLGGARTAHLDIGVHAATALAGVDGRRDRIGVQAAISFGGPIEYAGSISAIVNVIDKTSALARSGWEATLVLRGRPLGKTTAWYVGGGIRIAGLRATPAQDATDETNALAVTGVELPLGAARPFVELRVLNPWSPQAGVVVGVSVRAY